MDSIKKQEYIKPQISELSNQLTSSTKVTPGTEGSNPGGQQDPKFGS